MKQGGDRERRFGDAPRGGRFGGPPGERSGGNNYQSKPRADYQDRNDSRRDNSRRDFGNDSRGRSNYQKDSYSSNRDDSRKFEPRE